MSDNCPTCKRAFENIADYPFIYVVGFKRMEIPAGKVFPYTDLGCYSTPGVYQIGSSPPQAVLDFFKRNIGIRVFEQGNDIWQKADRHSYHHSKKDVRSVIEATINPYLDALERLVGQEVSTTQALPHFEETKYTGRYNKATSSSLIPETSNRLSLHAMNYPHDINWLRQNSISFPDFETPPTTKKISLLITNEGHGSMSVVRPIAIVGVLAYEGRVHTEDERGSPVLSIR